MKLYIAHNLSAREWLPSVIKDLNNAGHTCTSTWVVDDAHANGNSLSSALVDIADIDRADAVVLFVDQYGATPGKGKYVELGYALGTRKQVYLVGMDSSCVFYALPCLVKVKTIEQLIEVLRD